MLFFFLLLLLFSFVFYAAVIISGWQTTCSVSSTFFLFFLYSVSLFYIWTFMSATFVFLLNPQWVSHGKWYSEELVFFVLFALFSFTILLPLTKHFKTLPLFLLNIAQRFWFMPWSPFAWMIVIPLSLVSAKKTHLNLLQIRQNSAARITSTPSPPIIPLVIQLY